MNKQIRLEVHKQNFRIFVPNAFKNMMSDFTSRLISYNKLFNRKKKRYIQVEDKKWWAQRNLGHETMYIFQIEILRDVFLFFKIQGVNMLDNNLFTVINKIKTYPSTTNLKLKDFFVLRDYQHKYVETVCNQERAMRKALIELQTGR